MRLRPATAYRNIYKDFENQFSTISGALKSMLEDVEEPLDKLTRTTRWAIEGVKPYQRPIRRPMREDERYIRTNLPGSSLNIF